MFQDEEFTGTTIMAVSYNGGVILGADTRTSMGSYIPNRVTDKITSITPNIYCCRSGSSADTQAVCRVVKSLLEKYIYLEQTPEGSLVETSVRKAAILSKNVIYKYPSLCASLIVAGYDNLEGGSVYVIGLGGSLLRREWALGGSGSLYIYGYADKMYRNDFTFEERLMFVKDCISLAIGRDNSSGGCIRIVVVSKEGVKRYFYEGE